VTPAITTHGVCKHFKRYGKRAHWTLKETLLNWKRTQKNSNSEGFIQVLKDITFVVSQGTTLGIIGRNGSGKSTLLKTLGGIYHPDAGTIQINGRVAALLSLGVGFHPDLTGRENVQINGLVLGLTRRQIRERFDAIVQFAEMEEFIDAPVRTYSSGMYVRLAFSIAVNVDPDILLLDEVLAVGDSQFAKKCRTRVEDFKQQKKTILLVTHDIATVESWCDQALWLDHGEMQALGNPKEIVELYRSQILKETSPM
jgi:ABC-type polysaccharide/polyol phosphate transport system ATPase subunit